MKPMKHWTYEEKCWYREVLWDIAKAQNLKTLLNNENNLFKKEIIKEAMKEIV